MDANFTRHLSRLYPYAGAAWHQREIVIPEAWEDKTITLLLERTKNSRVWVDERFLGEQDSLAAPHIYEISGAHRSAGRLAPGKHRVTICINNGKRPPVNGGHQLSDDTQTDWNGILGRIELQAHDSVWIEAQRVFAKNDGSIRVEVDVRNDLAAAGRIAVAIREKAAGRVVARGGGEFLAASKGAAGRRLEAGPAAEAVERVQPRPLRRGIASAGRRRKVERHGQHDVWFSRVHDPRHTVQP